MLHFGIVLSRGRGIKCFNNMDKIMDYVVGKETQFVAQKYIENPLLINNKVSIFRNNYYNQFITLEIRYETMGDRARFLPSESMVL